uniref:Transmembrane protein n=1 Tax=Meloidogyne incognita TaxID=6306 RepID=A0A914LF53_MELIC
MSTNNNNLCVDPSRLTLAIFGAIFGTLLLCTGFALAVWYLVRNHQFADKLLFPEAAGKYNNRRKKQQQQKTENEAEAAQENNTIEEISSTTQKEFKNEIVLEMNEINKTTKIVEIKSPQPQQQSMSPREEEIYGTAEDYQIKRPPKIKEKNFEKINEENNRKIEEEKEEKMREEEKEKKKVEDEVDKLKKTEIINGKKFMSEVRKYNNSEIQILVKNTKALLTGKIQILMYKIQPEFVQIQILAYEQKYKFWFSENTNNNSAQRKYKF